MAHRFDAVYVGWGAEEASSACLGEIHPFTQGSAIRNIFAGGSLLGGEAASSPSRAAESGVRAANSIERLFQKVSLSAGRAKEGVYQSKLPACPAEGASSHAVTPDADSDGYTATQAREEAARCLQCHCMACRQGCVYLREFDKYPGNSIRSVVKNVNIKRGWGARDANHFIHSCTLCGLCGKRCPAGIDMGFVNLNARRIMWERGTLPPAIHDFPLRDMAHSLETAPRPRHQSGYSRSRYALYPGCQLPASMPETVIKLYGLISERLEGGVGLLSGCCGAPAEWAGREGESEKARGKLKADWAALGEPVLLVCCPGCYKVLQESLPEIPVQFIAEALSELELPLKTGGPAYTFHDPCSSRAYPAVQDSGRVLAAQMGAALEELPQNRERTECCGFGGLQYHVNPGLTSKTGANRVRQSPLPYLSTCSNCRDFFRSAGKDAVHVLELVFGREEAKGSSAWASIDFTKRRQTREQCHRELGERFWGERLEEGGEAVRLEFDDGLPEKMHKQCILEQDIRQLLLDARSDGRTIRSNETGWLVSGRQYGYVTYWVEYTVEQGIYHVHNAYSHRIQILRKDGNRR